MKAQKSQKQTLKPKKNPTKNRRKTNLKIETNPTKTIKKSSKIHLKTSPKISKIPTHIQSKITPSNFLKLTKKWLGVG